MSRDTCIQYTCIQETYFFYCFSWVTQDSNSNTALSLVSLNHTTFTCSLFPFYLFIFLYHARDTVPRVLYFTTYFTRCTRVRIVAATTAQAASHAKTLAAVTVDIDPAKVTISGMGSAAADNWVGGTNELSVSFKVDVAAADTAVTVTAAIEATTKNCKVEPAVIPTQVTLQLTVPADLKTALDTLANVITLPITSAKLETAYTLPIADKSDGSFVVSLREYATGDVQAALMLSGSDITIEVEKLGVKQAGILVPLTATVSIMVGIFFQSFNLSYKIYII